MKKIAVFPGSFSPFTLGHKSIIERSIHLFDQIIISIGMNSEKENNLFSIEDRKRWIQNIYAKDHQIDVQTYQGLTVDYCKKVGAQYIIRGLRSSNDFRYERDISQMNRMLNKNIDTIFIIASPETSHISSSLVRDIIKNGGDVSKFLPKEINL